MAKIITDKDRPRGIFIDPPGEIGWLAPRRSHYQYPKGYVNNSIRIHNSVID